MAGHVGSEQELISVITSTSTRSPLLSGERQETVTMLLEERFFVRLLQGQNLA